MNRLPHVWLRRALVWLMLLAIPFQGIASAGILACTHAPVPHAAAMPMAAMHQGNVQSRHCDEARLQGAMQAADPTDFPDPAIHGQDQGQDHDQERCSACAACCIGAAMAGAPTLPAAPPTLSTRLTDAATGRLEAVDLALPERPPRYPLA